MITPQERQYLNGVGLRIIKNLVGLCASTVLYAVFFVLFAYSVAAALERNKTRREWAMFSTMLFSFLLATMYWVLYVAWFVLWLREAFQVDHASGRLSGLEKVHASQLRAFKVAKLSDWIRRVVQLIGDAIVFWRAYALHARKPYMIVFPLLLLLATCATSFAYLILTTNLETFLANFSGKLQGSNVLTDNLFSATTALSLATNASSTLLIAYIFWTHSKLSKNAMLRQSPVANILLLLAESGAVYCVIQVALNVICFAKFNLPTGNPPLDRLVAFIFETHLQSTAMYPTIVWLLCRRKRSVIDNLSIVYAAAIASREP
ncbi:hypothetical protein LshimejAT787_0702670 [Lyophyllum shimeji]|uniref:Uncharacterized protein n=1 Tax=Lyophyllum shimeji TaxID=47721 RepID=A0A9P3PNM9_LYOSH|nr:hypothetical protein LshimejAT787_0702670 [Lyophyllum shimeji]